MKKKKVIIFTGGTGRFVSEFKKIKNNFKVYYPSKRKVDILKFHSITKFIKEKKPNYFIHCAGLSRPMSVHDKEINKSIDLNIIGTANVVKACEKFNLKLKGVLNVGGKTQSVYKFAKKYNPKIKKSSGRHYFPPRISMNLKKLKRILKK